MGEHAPALLYMLAREAVRIATAEYNATTSIDPKREEG